MSSLIPMAVSMGQQDAQNPGINYNQFASQLSSLDPVGNEITKIGGDPLNLYGNKNNPNALFFPSRNPNTQNGGVPSVLPTLPGVGGPQTYNPGSFGGYAKLGAGPYDQMASQMAGPMYNPQLASSAAPSKGLTATPAAGKGVAAPATLGGRSATMPYIGNLRAK